MASHLAEDLQLVDLPTGKPHISFSEYRDWKDCSYRHKLKHVKKIDLGKPGPLLDFGTAVHAACEQFLKTRVMDASIATKMIASAWEKNKDVKGFEPATVPVFQNEATNILADVPAFMEETFPGWEYIDAEHQLYETIEGHPHAFKGFIDGIIRTKDKKDLVWLIDWKTTSWGWDMRKKTDETVRTQLVLYKTFWARKMGVDLKDIRCGFVLLKRSAKPNQHCELVPTSVGEVTANKSLKVINNMLSSVKKGIALKNRSSCTYCEYHKTEHCT